MIIYLFGGSSAENDDLYHQLLLGQLRIINPSQILFLGFAGLGNESPRGNSIRAKLKRLFSEGFLDASVDADLERADKPLIYVSGGLNHTALYERVINHQRLNDLVLGTDYYFGNSAGAMLVGSKQRLTGENGSSSMLGLGILKETVIEPHYTQNGRRNLLNEEMKNWDCRFGIGIDEACAIKIDSGKFPEGVRSWGKVWWTL